MAEPTSKRRKQCFTDTYTAAWPFIVKSSVSDNHARCTICNCDLNIAGGGRSDLIRHIEKPKHEKNAKAKSSTPTLSSMFAKDKDPKKQSAANAEALFTAFLVEHNAPLSLADHAGPLFRNMFPDSSIAKDFKCARTKTRHVVSVMAGETRKLTLDSLKGTSTPFSLSTDGSNDKGKEQLYPVLVPYHNGEQVVTNVLDITTPQGNSTGWEIFSALNVTLQNYGLEWKNCISFGSDNASVMLGKLNGVASHIKEVNPEVHIVGCPCHLLHIAAKSGTNCLQCPMEERLIDIFHYLENSSKRMKALETFQRETGTAIRKILKHGPTRWLSLKNCIDRLLDQWEALSQFFAAESSSTPQSKKNDRLLRINTFFDDKTSRLYCLFLSYALPKFTNANLLQNEEPVIHLLRRRIHDIATDLLIAFIKPNVISETNNLYQLEHHRRSKQKDREDLAVGEKTREYLSRMKSEGISKDAITNFFQDVGSFYSASLKYLFNKLPMDQEELAHAEILDVKLRQQNKFSSIRFWLSKFQCIRDTVNVDKLEIEFSKYQIDPLSDLDVNTRVDVLWARIGSLTDSVGAVKYPTLVKVMKGLLAIPHSNAEAERVFSLVRKNKTEARASMSKALLSDIIVSKVGMIASGKVCHTMKFSPSALENITKKGGGDEAEK